MRIATLKRHQFCFDGWAISWTDGLDLSIIKRRVFESLAQDAVNFCIRVARPAVELWKWSMLRNEREAVKIVFTRLQFHFIEVYRTRVDADRSTSLHSKAFDAEFVECCGEEG